MTALLVYGLLCNSFSFLKSSDVLNSSLKLVDIDPFLKYYGHFNLSFKADLPDHQTNTGNVGYGKHILTTTFVFPSLFNTAKKCPKPSTRIQQGDALIIMICLLLSGDVHPCPGPTHKEQGNGSISAEATCNSTVSQVRALCLDGLPFANVQQANECLSGVVGGLVPTPGTST